MKRISLLTLIIALAILFSCKKETAVTPDNTAKEENPTEEENEIYFTVSESGKRVRFTHGNLYWNGSAFALEKSQFSSPTEWNSNHIGHFKWAKTAEEACDTNANVNNPQCTDRFFCDGGDAAHQLTIEGQSGLYALSNSEWGILLSGITKEREGKYKYPVTVNGISGCVVIAPDQYKKALLDEYSETTTPKWSEAEEAGVICLTPNGYRDKAEIESVGGGGSYLSSTPDETDPLYCYQVSFGDRLYSSASYIRTFGKSVRLVWTVSEGK